MKIINRYLSVYNNVRGTQMESSTTIGKEGSHSQRCVMALQTVCGSPGLHWSASSQKSPTRKPRLFIDIAGIVSAGPSADHVDDHLVPTIMPDGANGKDGDAASSDDIAVAPRPKLRCLKNKKNIELKSNILYIYVFYKLIYIYIWLN